VSEPIPPYAQTRDANQPWFGQIPTHWDEASLASIAKVKSVRNRPERQLLSVYLHRGVVRFSDVDERRTNPTSADLSLYQAVDPGDFVLNNQQAWRGSVGVSSLAGIVSPAYLVLALSNRLLTKYANLLLRDPSMVGQYLTASKGVGSIQRNLYWPYLKRASVLVPPIEDQAAIVRYLDHMDRRIRRYIRAKQKLIKLLEEEKQAIIYRAVTGRVDVRTGQPYPTYKPSGVEWLGNVPEEWEVRRAKTLFREVDQRSATGSEVLLSLRMYEGLIPHHEVSSIPTSAEALVGYKRVEPGQIVMNRMRAAIGLFGVADRPGIVSPDYAIFEVNRRVHPEYYLRLFKTPEAMGMFRVESKGLGTGSSGFMRLYTDRFGAITLPQPPHDQQIAIVDAVRVETADVTRAQDRVRSEVGLMNEYRTRLIADVVAGKLDVREAAALVPDEPADEEPLEDAQLLEEEELLEPVDADA